MDEEENREPEVAPENPRLKRIPLNLGSRFLRASRDEEVPNILTQYPVLLLLFAADWCNISKPFINNLKSHYEEINLQAKNMEVIYISFDKSKKEWEEMSAGVPWLSISFDDPRVRDLKQFYNVRSIPSLILVDSQGEVVSNSCREDVYELKEDPALEKWVKLKEASDAGYCEQ